MAIIWKAFFISGIVLIVIISLFSSRQFINTGSYPKQSPIADSIRFSGRKVLPPSRVLPHISLTFSRSVLFSIIFTRASADGQWYYLNISPYSQMFFSWFQRPPLSRHLSISKNLFIRGVNKAVIANMIITSKKKKRFFS